MRRKLNPVNTLPLHGKGRRMGKNIRIISFLCEQLFSIKLKKHIITSFISLVFFLLSYQGNCQDTLKYQSLKPHDFNLKYLNEDQSMLIDVREPFEYKSKRIKGAVNIPSGKLEATSDTINKDLALFLYCTSGVRSSRAAKSLYDKGFRKIYSLDGGIGQWQKDGLKVDKSRLKKKRVSR